MAQNRSVRPQAKAPRRERPPCARPRRATRVLVVDEHPIVGVALRAIFASDPAIAVDAATDPIAAERAIAAGSADLVVSEIAFSGRSDGLELARIPAPRAPIVLLTGLSFPGVLQAALDVGAEGVLSKAASVTEIVRAIRTVVDGGTVASQSVLDAARQARRRPATRELAVIAELATGASNATIAERLSIRRPTVEAVLRRLFDRYSVTSRTALVVLAEREGWLFGRAA